jgi:hypothetical protein
VVRQIRNRFPSPLRGRAGPALRPETCAPVFLATLIETTFAAAASGDVDTARVAHDARGQAARHDARAGRRSGASCARGRPQAASAVLTNRPVKSRARVSSTQQHARAPHPFRCGTGAAAGSNPGPRRTPIVPIRRAC